jgi:DDE superfamily endonuclease
LPRQAVCSLGHRLYAFWERFREDFKTQTRDGSDYAYHYLSGLLRMDTKRHFAGIGREAGISGQNLQHFMSASPWSGQAVCRRVQEELKATPELTASGVLLIDESADEKAGDKSAGVGRQYNGRLGKVEMSQVAVLLSYLNLKVAQGFWSWIDGALFLPEVWFGDSHETLRQRLGVPPEMRFKTKVELAWELIERALAANIPFDLVGFDCLYGRESVSCAPRCARPASSTWRKCRRIPQSTWTLPSWVCRPASLSVAASLRPSRSWPGRRCAWTDLARAAALAGRSGQGHRSGGVVRPVCRPPGLDGARGRGGGGVAGDAEGK